MTKRILSFKIGVSRFWDHDNSVVILEDGKPLFGIESERVLRNKHGNNGFPSSTIEVALDECDLSLGDVDTVALPYDTDLEDRRLESHLDSILKADLSPERRSELIRRNVAHYEDFKTALIPETKSKLGSIGDVPDEIVTYSHHRCHASSAFYPAPFDEGLVVTLDGRGEHDSTVVWHGNGRSLERVRTYEFPNSLGMFYGLITEYLGYNRLNGEGKIMGLSPYGNPNPDIESVLETALESGVEYDVSEVTGTTSIESGIRAIERLFGRERKTDEEPFTQWEKDLAYATQKFVEETVTEIVSHYCREFDVSSVGLAGGVALNCKMNKAVMGLPEVTETFVQPVANDAGLSVGAAMLSSEQRPRMDSVFLGTEYGSEDIETYLDTVKIAYEKPAEMERYVAESIADGALVGWFQGRMEMGPRALGHRSILADPRRADSRDRINKHVKNREEWRPFAPSMLEEHAEDYLIDHAPAPFMIKTFDVPEDKQAEIPAVLHPADGTTRPQLVSKRQNPTYYRLIKHFSDITGTPVLLNTSFNDNGEPIVESPKNAIDDFFSMGLDLLVLEDVVLSK